MVEGVVGGVWGSEGFGASGEEDDEGDEGHDDKGDGDESPWWEGFEARGVLGEHYMGVCVTNGFCCAKRVICGFVKQNVYLRWGRFVGKKKKDGADFER